MPLQNLMEQELIRVYRIDSGLHGLDNRNAGNLAAVLNFLEITNDDLMEVGDYLSLFEVIVEQGYGEYVEFTRGRPRINTLIVERHVGKRERDEKISYSFPESGLWKMKRKIGSIPLHEVEAILETSRFQIRHPYSEVASYVEKLFAQRFDL